MKKLLIIVIILLTFCGNGWCNMNDDIKSMNKKIDDMYSMLFDLEVKFMGIDRAEQICMPEVHAQKLADKMKERER